MSALTRQQRRAKARGYSGFTTFTNAVKDARVIKRVFRRGPPIIDVTHDSIALRNRWTGKPHEHRREIARRHRQSIMHGAA